MNIGIELPKEYVTQKGAILGVTGSGKSYGAGAIIEEFLKEKIPFVLLDVMGAHYGLSEKFNILIYGGIKGHPLDPKQGEVFAEAILNLIVASSLMSVIGMTFRHKNLWLHFYRNYLPYTVIRRHHDISLLKKQR